MTLDPLRRRFLSFAEKECVPASPLYARLARGVAQAAEVQVDGGEIGRGGENDVRDERRAAVQRAQRGEAGGAEQLGQSAPVVVGHGEPSIAEVAL